MAYVSGYEHDVFVSYAHVDNEPLAGVDEGWVSLLAQNIQKLVDRKLGRKDSCDLWMDYRLRNHESFTPKLLDAVGKSATLLVVLSSGYLASPWCERERKAFREMVRGRDSSNIFVVELEPLGSDRPTEFNELLGYRFWVHEPGQRCPRLLGFPKPDDSEREYYSSVNDLCHEIAGALKSLKAAGQQQSELSNSLRSPPPISPNKSVFLAEATDDLWTDRKSVRDYLDQIGVPVLPSKLYPQDAEGFRFAAEKDLECCDLFVQLLSCVPGRMPDDVPQGYPTLQYELAQAAGKTILQWRSPALDLDSANIAVVRELLQEPTVRAEPIADFKTTLKEMILSTQSEDQPEPMVGSFIFVNREPEDKKLAEAVQQELFGLGVDVVWTPEYEDARERREFLEQTLSACDGMVLIHGKSPGSWVSSQLLQWRKAFARRRNETLRELAICRFPPMPKEELNMKLQSLRIFDCDFDDGDDGDDGGSGGAARQHLHAFLEDLVATVRA